MIRIKEEKLHSNSSKKIFVTLENHGEYIFDTYPIILKPKEMNNIIYKASVLNK